MRLINSHNVVQREILNKKLKLKVASTDGGEDHETFVEVRDYLEQLVEGLVDGGLDDVCLTPLSTHPEYMSICWKYHEKLATTLTAAIQAIVKESDDFEKIPERLRVILDELYSDVEHLPELQSAQKKCVVPLAEDLDEKNYEDLLATAILNKIVSNSQTKKRVSDGNPRYGKLPTRSSGSSLNSLCSKRTDDSWGSNASPERLSFTVEERVAQVTTTSYNHTYSDVEGDYDDGYNEGDDDDDERSQSTLGIFMSNAKLLRGHKTPLPDFGSDVVDDCSGIDVDDRGLGAKVDSWEDNWLFQKKKHNRNDTGSNNGYHHHPVPVPMLVPNPCDDSRPLIGDRDADETSELSDYSNSALDELLELSDSQESELIKPSEIDGRSIDQLTFEGPSSEEDNPLNWDPVVEACNKHVALSQADSGQGSLELHRDYDQTVEIVEVIEKPVPRPRSSLNANIENQPTRQDESSCDESLPPRPGTIAAREHSKWENAVPMANNPYSAENIEKRKYKSKFSSRSGSDSSLDLTNVNDPSKPMKIVCSPKLPDSQKYGRDFYINNSADGAGSKGKQTKVSKLVGQMEDNGGQTLDFERKQTMDNVVRVCSWSDRQDGSPLPSPTAGRDSSGDDEFHMPSVKELAKQFSSHIVQSKATSFKQVHSLTARSIRKEFREGLGLKVRQKNGQNLKNDSDDSGNGSAILADDVNTLE
ncbi:uncharacterized protein LOC126836086 isoform X2 [Adelges cooleyi]|uniref:uncharacterized protein LOC126836086 isoform X2 n=1 Tax=Adelges cooleyi TaxID=133065 RepID=UPI00217FF342|nr:uncharacterized protein LOC126836086 isoform X2 [Adelges cooleyi]